MKQSNDAEIDLKKQIQAYQNLIKKHDGKTFVVRDINRIKEKLANLKADLSKHKEKTKKKTLKPKSTIVKDLNKVTYLDVDLKQQVDSFYKYPTYLDDVLIYTDGACLSNPGGKGGYGLVVLKEENKELLFEASASVQSSTNNRMELIGMLKAFQYLNTNNFQFATIRSDSEYVVNTLSKGWIHKWHKENYKKRANADLWKQIYPLFMKHFKSIKVEWVKAHSVDEFNNKVDKLAYNAASNHE